MPASKFFARRALPIRVDLRHAKDMDGFRAALDGPLTGAEIVAVLAKTPGDGSPADTTRAAFVTAASAEVARIQSSSPAFVVSGGVEGTTAPNALIVARKAARGPARGKALAVGAAVSSVLANDRAGTAAQIDDAYDAVRAALKDGGFVSLRDVHLAQIKSPAPASFEGPAETAIGRARAATVLGAMVALGELTLAQARAAFDKRDLRRWTARVSVSSAAEFDRQETVIFGHAPGWAGDLRIAQLGLDAKPQLNAASRAADRVPGQKRPAFGRAFAQRGSRFRRRSHAVPSPARARGPRQPDRGGDRRAARIRLGRDGTSRPAGRRDLRRHRAAQRKARVTAVTPAAIAETWTLIRPHIRHTPALGHKATIFVPGIASPAKIERIRSYGAELVVGGERYADALAACEAHIARTGALSIHACDQIETLMGQGTLAAEIEADHPDLDTLLVAVGGGGLIGGIASWYAGRRKIVAVESDGAPTLHAAFAAGKPVDAPAGGIAADSLAPKQVGALMFPIARAYVAPEVVLVTDDQIRAAQAALWSVSRIVAEPGGAAAFAALLSGRYRPAQGERVGVLVCGSNTTAVSFD